MTSTAVVGVIGGGCMCAGIPSFAAAGSSVTVVENGEQAAAGALDRIATGLKKATEQGGLIEAVESVLAWVTTVNAPCWFGAG